MSAFTYWLQLLLALSCGFLLGWALSTRRYNRRVSQQAADIIQTFKKFNGA